MSAFLHGPNHFNTLVTWAINHPDGPKYYYFGKEWKPVSEESAAILYAANLKSVRARYGREKGDDYGYEYSSIVLGMPKDSAVIAKACSSLDYQSCEADDWKASEAYAILNAIREAAIADLCKDCGGWQL